MIRPCVTAAVLLGLCLSAESRAEEPVTSGDVEACQPDVHRLCDAQFPDAKLVADCLVDKRAQLSPACAEALARPRSPDRPPEHPTDRPTDSDR